MTQWTTKKQRNTLILRNPRQVWIENYREKDRVPKHIFNSWTKEEQEFYYIFNGLYNHGYYPYGCDLKIPPRMVKEMREAAQRRKKTDIYENGMRESEFKMEKEAYDEWVKDNSYHSSVIGTRSADTLAKHGGIEFAIATVAKRLDHLDGTLDTETEINITNFMWIIARIVNEERINRSKKSIWTIPLYIKEELQLTLPSSAIDEISLGEARKYIKKHGFGRSLLILKADLIRRIKSMHDRMAHKNDRNKLKQSMWGLLKIRGMLIAALIRKGERRERYEY